MLDKTDFFAYLTCATPLSFELVVSVLADMQAQNPRAYTETCLRDIARLVTVRRDAVQPIFAAVEHHARSQLAMSSKGANLSTRSLPANAADELLHPFRSSEPRQDLVELWIACNVMLQELRDTLTATWPNQLRRQMNVPVRQDAHSHSVTTTPFYKYREEVKAALAYVLKIFVNDVLAGLDGTTLNFIRRDMLLRPAANAVEASLYFFNYAEAAELITSVCNAFPRKHAHHRYLEGLFAQASHFLLTLASDNTERHSDKVYKLWSLFDLMQSHQVSLNSDMLRSLTTALQNGLYSDAFPDAISRTSAQRLTPRGVVAAKVLAAAVHAQVKTPIELLHLALSDAKRSPQPERKGLADAITKSRRPNSDSAYLYDPERQCVISTPEVFELFIQSIVSLFDTPLPIQTQYRLLKAYVATWSLPDDIPLAARVVHALLAQTPGLAKAQPDHAAVELVKTLGIADVKPSHALLRFVLSMFVRKSEFDNEETCDQDVDVSPESAVNTSMRTPISNRKLLIIQLDIAQIVVERERAAHTSRSRHLAPAVRKVLCDLLVQMSWRSIRVDLSGAALQTTLDLLAKVTKPGDDLGILKPILVATSVSKYVSLTNAYTLYKAIHPHHTFPTTLRKLGVTVPLCPRDPSSGLLEISGDALADNVAEFPWQSNLLDPTNSDDTHVARNLVAAFPLGHTLPLYLAVDGAVALMERNLPLDGFVMRSLTRNFDPATLPFPLLVRILSYAESHKSAEMIESASHFRLFEKKEMQQYKRDEVLIPYMLAQWWMNAFIAAVRHVSRCDESTDERSMAAIETAMRALRGVALNLRTMEKQLDKTQQTRIYMYDVMPGLFEERMARKDSARLPLPVSSRMFRVGAVLDVLWAVIASAYPHWCARTDMEIFITRVRELPPTCASTLSNAFAQENLKPPAPLVDAVRSTVDGNIAQDKPAPAPLSKTESDPSEALVNMFGDLIAKEVANNNLGEARELYHTLVYHAPQGKALAPVFDLQKTSFWDYVNSLVTRGSVSYGNFQSFVDQVSHSEKHDLPDELTDIDRLEMLKAMTNSQLAHIRSGDASTTFLRMLDIHSTLLRRAGSHAELQVDLWKAVTGPGVPVLSTSWIPYFSHPKPTLWGMLCYAVARQMYSPFVATSIVANFIYTNAATKQQPNPENNADFADALDDVDDGSPAVNEVTSWKNWTARTTADEASRAQLVLTEALAMNSLAPVPLPVGKLIATVTLNYEFFGVDGAELKSVYERVSDMLNNAAVETLPQQEATDPIAYKRHVAKWDKRLCSSMVTAMRQFMEQKQYNAVREVFKRDFDRWHVPRNRHAYFYMLRTYQLMGDHPGEALQVYRSMVQKDELKPTRKIVHVVLNIFERFYGRASVLKDGSSDISEAKKAAPTSVTVTNSSSADELGTVTTDSGAALSPTSPAFVEVLQDLYSHLSMEHANSRQKCNKEALDYQRLIIRSLARFKHFAALEEIVPHILWTLVKDSYVEYYKTRMVEGVFSGFAIISEIGYIVPHINSLRYIDQRLPPLTSAVQTLASSSEDNLQQLQKTVSAWTKHYLKIAEAAGVHMSLLHSGDVNHVVAISEFYAALMRAYMAAGDKENALSVFRDFHKAVVEGERKKRFDIEHTDLLSSALTEPYCFMMDMYAARNDIDKAFEIAKKAPSFAYKESKGLLVRELILYGHMGELEKMWQRYQRVREKRHMKFIMARSVLMMTLRSSPDAFELIDMDVHVSRLYQILRDLREAGIPIDRRVADYLISVAARAGNREAMIFFYKETVSIKSDVPDVSLLQILRSYSVAHTKLLDVSFIQRFYLRYVRDMGALMTEAHFQILTRVYCRLDRVKEAIAMLEKTMVGACKLKINWNIGLELVTACSTHKDGTVLRNKVLPFMTRHRISFSATPLMLKLALVFSQLKMTQELQVLYSLLPEDVDLRLFQRVPDLALVHVHAAVTTGLDRPEYCQRVAESLRLYIYECVKGKKLNKLDNLRMTVEKLNSDGRLPWMLLQHIHDLRHELEKLASNSAVLRVILLLLRNAMQSMHKSQDTAFCLPLAVLPKNYVGTIVHADNEEDTSVKAAPCVLVQVTLRDIATLVREIDIVDPAAYVGLIITCERAGESELADSLLKEFLSALPYCKINGIHAMQLLTAYLDLDLPYKAFDTWKVLRTYIPLTNMSFCVRLTRSLAEKTFETAKNYLRAYETGPHVPAVKLEESTRGMAAAHHLWTLVGEHAHNPKLAIYALQPILNAAAKLGDVQYGQMVWSELERSIRDVLNGPLPNVEAWLALMGASATMVELHSRHDSLSEEWWNWRKFTWSITCKICHDYPKIVATVAGPADEAEWLSSARSSKTADPESYESSAVDRKRGLHFLNVFDMSLAVALDACGHAENRERLEKVWEDGQMLRKKYNILTCAQTVNTYTSLAEAYIRVGDFRSGIHVVLKTVREDGFAPDTKMYVHVLAMLLLRGEQECASSIVRHIAASEHPEFIADVESSLRKRQINGVNAWDLYNDLLRAA